MVQKKHFRRIGICWGAQVLLKVFHNVEKHQLKNKMFGIFDHQLSENNNRLLHGFTDYFQCQFLGSLKTKQMNF